MLSARMPLSLRSTLTLLTLLTNKRKKIKDKEKRKSSANIKPVKLVKEVKRFYFKPILSNDFTFWAFASKLSAT